MDIGDYNMLAIFGCESCALQMSFPGGVHPSYIQDVSEIGALILTGNRTRQKEQLFYLPFCRKTMFNSKKNWRDSSLK
jgi:hypothetical protein